MKTKLFLMVMGLVLVLFCYSSAQVPQMINYQGKLTTSAGAPVNGTLQMVFTIYADSNGTTSLWTETQPAVVVDKGVFNVLLGSVSSIPYSVFDGSIRYLGVKVGDDPEITPRKPMVSVGYAYRANTDGDWVFHITDGNDTTLMTGGAWGIARYGNVLYGNADSTHVNLGVACTTGTSGENYKCCTVGGGLWNTASSGNATVGGGYRNAASGWEATVGGGGGNTASGWRATIGGGVHNTASGWLATVGGGESHTASNSFATVGGGYSSQASNYSATVGGGYANIASGEYTTVGGGHWDTASGLGATVGGGQCNTASGLGATVPGGGANAAAGDYSFAAGTYVTLTSTADYTFAFGNNFTTSTPNAVIFYHYGSATRVGINKTDPSYALHLPNNADASGQDMANAWNAYSSIRWKENINPIDHALEKVLALRGVYFDWKESKKHGIGMIAEEVGKVIPEVVSYEENGVDAQAMDYARLTALLVEAIKEQQMEIEALKIKLEKLESDR